MNIRIKFTIIVLMIIFMTVCISSAAEIHFTPSFSVSEEYTDNYFQTDNNTESESSTEYMLGLDFEYIETKGEVSLNYNLSYVDYHEYDDNDSWLHDLELIGLLNLTRHTELTLTESFS
ncbi:MAG: hypothetical protein KAJ62_12005, partial [Desulfobacteraceae bacterium]|nr:hypothetical protein [Desulfobacteraceae bacterium]